MVSDLALGALIAGISTATGSLGTAYIQMQRSKIEQQGEDKRLIAQNFASQKAECVQELGYQLNNCQRVYTEAVGEAARHNLTEEKYREYYENKYEDLYECWDKSVIYLEDRGEQEILNYIGHLIDAENYLIIKMEKEDEELEYRNGDLAELIQHDNPDLDYGKWIQDYKHAKNALRNDISDRFELLSSYTAR